MTLFWVCILALTILLYVLLDGFDLGVGILFLFSRDEGNRRRMLAAISPVWDGNETWLVLTGTILFGAFSRVYALVLAAFYLPVMIGLCALVLRGVAIEFRHRATISRPFWDAAFAGGSLVATFVQGAALGALATGLPIENGQYIGGAFAWLSAFAVLTGLGLCLAYSLLGAAWLVKKCEGRVRDAGYAMLPWLLLGIAAIVIAAAIEASMEKLEIMNRWIQRPYLACFVVLGALSGWGVLRGIRTRRDSQPFFMATLMFCAAFCIVACSFWPYMVPFSLTIDSAASPPESMWFMFWGAGLVVLPVTVGYTLTVYRIFRGKITDTVE